VHTVILLENLKGKDHLGGRVMLKLLLWKWGGKMWTGFILFRIGAGGGTY